MPIRRWSFHLTSFKSASAADRFPANNSPATLANDQTIPHMEPRLSDQFLPSDMRAAEIKFAVEPGQVAVVAWKNMAVIRFPLFGLA